ncbi:MAG: UDP-N-acetylmuramate--L-alanine ligase [Deltaproteobacteria bacterium]|nr:UDP-N-acetylmuramate--L-alanine ligase [Deltaproteobacteria bacterium]MCW5803646.1 UDP-N-acetylmuramate--L-alanine ligase [Deltaproteobacteria bacterium]
MFRKQDTKIHFVGIGGMGMCGIAEVLANMGYRVSGSDMNDTEITRHLTQIGCSVVKGHRADNLGEADVVVVSSAIKGYNPEIEAARARQIPVIPRAEMLGELMRMKYGIAIAGAHGKTTSTTMVHTILMTAGLDPTAVIGGRVNSLGLANARWGKSDYLVAEADESDGSFLTLTPTLAVVTNIDAEHLDHYGTFDNVKKAFTDFCNRVPFFGMSALCLDNAGVQAILPNLTKRYTTFGISSQATYRARNIRPDGMTTRFVAWRRAEELGEVVLPMPGAHNVLNALGALAIADFVGIAFDTYAKAMAQFEGIARRFTVRGEVGGITIVDDFGHHPAEVRATLSGAKSSFANRRVVAAFQPHRYTRTRDQLAEFARAFHDADKVVICDIFAAGEKPIDGVTSETLVRLAREAGHTDITYVPRREDLAAWLDAQAHTGDLVITLGAGNIQLVCNEVIALLEKRFGSATRKNLVRVDESSATVAR